MPLFETHTRRDSSGRPVLVVTGDLDLATVPIFANAAAALPDLSDQGLVLDFAGLTFIDSTGLGALLELRQQVVAAGQELVIESSSAAVERVLELTGLTALFTASGDQA